MKKILVIFALVCASLTAKAVSFQHDIDIRTFCVGYVEVKISAFMPVSYQVKAVYLRDSRYDYFCDLTMRVNIINDEKYKYIRQDYMKISFPTWNGYTETTNYRQWNLYIEFVDNNRVEWTYNQFGYVSSRRLTSISNKVKKYGKQN